MLKRSVWVVALLLVCSVATSGLAATVNGNLTKWHRVTIDFDGPAHDEMDVSPNPFLDYRLQVEFTAPVSGTVYDVPGFFDGDGNGGGNGSVWRVRFAPDEPGVWTYRASFRSGTDVAVSLDPAAGTPTSFDGETGQFAVADTDPGADGFRKYGRLESIGEHHLKFRDGGYWVKVGTNNPENLLGYSGFDNTPYAWHSFANHVQDWNPGDPDWDSPDTASTTDGQGIIGALNYLESKNLNSIYFMPMNIGADGKDTYPFASTSIDRNGSSANDNVHYDISKLTQWEIVFNHAQDLEIFLHFVLSDKTRANKNELSMATLGVERKLFYRELIARFGHHNALQWNICEEYNLDLPLDPAVIKQFGEYIWAVDPYRHPVTVHPHGNTYEGALAPFLGDEWFKVMSVQTWQRPEDISYAIEYFRAETTAAGNPIPVMLDESIGMNQMDANAYRKRTFWDALFSGGGFEMFKSYGDSGVDDFRVYETYFEYGGLARVFVEDNLPFWSMVPDDGLVTGEDGVHGGAEVFTLPGEVYAIYLPSASPAATLSLAGAEGSFEQRWFNPRTGQFEGSIIDLTGGGAVSLGTPPSSTDDDWVVLVRSTAIPPTRSNGQPAGSLPSGTTETTISLDTDVDATCRYDTLPGTAYLDMPGSFDTTGGTAHATLVAGLTDGRSYSYYVRCENIDGHANTTDFVISFLVSAPPGSVIGDQGVWYMDEGAGPTASDSSGQGNHATLMNGAQWVAGHVGQGLRFDGVSSYARFPDSPSLDYAAWSGASVSLWAKAERLDHFDDQTLYGHWNASSSYRPMQVVLTDGNRWQCRTNHKDGDAQSPSAAVTDVWTHIACVWSPSGLELYIDGVLVDTDPSVQGYLHDNSGEHTFGVRDKSGVLSQFFQGSLDEVHVFSRALGPDEVLNLFTSAPQPDRTNGQPTGVLPAGTTDTTLSLDTDVDATCRYDTVPGTAYDAMPQTFETTGGTAHMTPVFGLADGQDYTYYVRCEDTDGNANNSDYLISFSVDLVIPTPPLRSNGQPSGVLPAGTTQTTISLDTDVDATCRYDTVPGTAYDAMASTFDVTGGSAHSSTVTGLSDGNPYAYHVRCRDLDGDTNDDDFTISFTVDLILPTPPVRSNGQPTGTLPHGTTQTTISLDTDVAADCRYDTAPGTSYGAMTSTFDVTGGTSHSSSISGLVDGQSYAYYVRCSDTQGDTNDDDFVISFLVETPGEPPSGDAAVWYLDEGVGDTTADSSGQGNTGTLMNNPSWVAGHVGQALRFDGATSYVTIPDAPSLDFNSWAGSTVALWANAERLDHDDDQTLYGHWNANSSQRPLQVVLTDANRWQCRTNHSDGDISSPLAAVPGVWTHVACVWTPTGLTLYIDGAPVATDPSVQGFLDPNAGNHTLGARDKSGAMSQFFQGSLDGVHIFSRALTDQEVQDLFAATPQPQRSNGQPSGLLPPGTTDTTLSLDTDVDADCRYSTSPGIAYDAMIDTFAVTGGTSHSTPISGLEDGQDYTYYVRCEDTDGNANTSDYLISFSVDVVLPTPPVRSNGQPSGLLPPGTTDATMSLDTDVVSDCRYDTVPGTDYAAMPFLFDTTGGTAHAEPLSGLVDGQTYTHYVRCRDIDGDTNDDDYVITFSVDIVLPTPPVRSNGQPSGTLPPGTTEATLSLDTDVGSDCRYDTVPGTAFDSMPGVFDTTGGLAHAEPLSGLVDGQTYTHYVRCRDTQGDTNSDDYTITFSVDIVGAPPAGDAAQWHLDEGTGSTANDLSGQGNHGTLVGGPAWTAGQIGQALRFDGSSSYVRVSDAPSLDFRSWSGATVAMWVKPESLNAADDQTLYGHWNASKSQRPFQVLLTPENRLQCRTNHRDGMATSPLDAVVDTWTHVTCVWTPAGLSLYIDGVLMATDGSVQSVLQNNSGDHTLGVRDKSGALSQFFQGTLDEVHIFSRALSPAEIDDLFMSGP